jgi:broad specificity phosphatase PhoE
LFSSPQTRHIYLIRHGKPEFPGGVLRCIGSTDLPLSREGERQAQRLGTFFENIPLTAVYTSTLTRAVQTAEAATRGKLPVIRSDALRELDCGLWEGLTFEEIQGKYPLLYAKRGTDPEQFAPEGGERFDEGLARFRAGVEQALRASMGDIAVVAHASVNRLLICSLLGKPFREVYSISQPYGGISEISVQTGILTVGRIGFLPVALPDEETIRNLWEEHHTPDAVRNHCRAVAEKALELARSLEERGYPLNKELIYSAALSHDIARAEPDHAARGAKWLAGEDYESIADIIAAHHDLDEEEDSPVTEKTVVYLADKLVSEDKEVTLEERFAKSAEKCVTPEAKAEHKRKYDQAAAAFERVQRRLKKEQF